MDSSAIERALVVTMRALPGEGIREDDIKSNKASTEVTEEGPWVWVCLKGRLSVDNDVPWSDATFSNRWVFHVQRDWVGQLETLPPSPTFEDLDTWAMRAWRYDSEVERFDHQDKTKEHRGGQVRGLDASGSAEVATARAPASKQDDLSACFECEDVTLT